MSVGAIFLTVSFFASFFVAAYYMLKNDEIEQDNKALWEQMYMNEAKARNWDRLLEMSKSGTITISRSSGKDGEE